VIRRADKEITFWPLKLAQRPHESGQLAFYAANLTSWWEFGVNGYAAITL
jgi:hypothetical protein